MSVFPREQTNPDYREGLEVGRRELAAKAAQIAALREALSRLEALAQRVEDRVYQHPALVMVNAIKKECAALAGNPPDLGGEPNPTKSALTEFIREGERIEAACDPKQSSENS